MALMMVCPVCDGEQSASCPLCQGARQVEVEGSELYFYKQSLASYNPYHRGTLEKIQRREVEAKAKSSYR